MALRAADNPTTAGGLCQLVKNLPNVVTTTNIIGQKGGSEPKIVADWDIPKIQNFRKTNLDNATPGHTAGSGREAEMNVDEFFNTYGPVTFILSDGSKLERITVPQRSAPDTPVYTVTFTPTKRIPPSIP